MDEESLWRLVQLDERDGRLLDNLLSEQSVERKRYELDEHAQKQKPLHIVNRSDKAVCVSVPEAARR